MNEWKINQEIYHRLNKDHGDSIDDKEVLILSDPKEILDYAIKYFTEDPGWVYPSKSYVVAICYATWIARDFMEDFYDVLNDPELLYGNDPYFKPYSESKDVYNGILEKVGINFDETQGVIADIKKYYEEECLLNGKK